MFSVYRKKPSRESAAQSRAALSRDGHASSVNAVQRPLKRTAFLCGSPHGAQPVVPLLKTLPMAAGNFKNIQLLVELGGKITGPPHIKVHIGQQVYLCLLYTSSSRCCVSISASRHARACPRTTEAPSSTSTSAMRPPTRKDRSTWRISTLP